MKQLMFAAALIVGGFGGLVIYRWVDANKQLQESRVQMRELESAFDTYALDLLGARTLEAYKYCSPAFKKETSFEAYSAWLNGIEQKLGSLRRIERNLISSEGTSSTVEKATVHADFVYDKGKITLIHQFHQRDGKWLLDSFVVQ